MVPGFAAGGPTPGGWYSVTCTDMSTGESYTETEWIPDPAVGSTPPIRSRGLLLIRRKMPQAAVAHIKVESVGSSIVILPTWLWIDSTAIWHP